MIPLSDDTPTHRLPVVTYTIMAACILVFLWQTSLSPELARQAIVTWGVVPARLFEPSPEGFMADWSSIISSMFMHGGWLHLGGNMLYLWIFGNNVEDSMTRPRFVAFYLVCGVVAALAQSLADPSSTLPMIGASGAIGGVLGAYLVLHPWANVRMLFLYFGMARVVNVPALLVLGMWFVLQLVSGFTTPLSGGGVAFWAHAGGFLAGIGLIPLCRRRAIPLWSTIHRPAFTVEKTQSFSRSQGRGSLPSISRREGES